MVVKGIELLAEAVRLRTYAKTLDDGTKESFDETVTRVQNMHVERFPQFQYEIEDAFDAVRSGRAVSSMRSMQFAGSNVAHERNYNCSFLNIIEVKDFSDILYLLTNGCGVGYSVQERHISQLPVICEGVDSVYPIEDTKESWADSISVLIKNPKSQFNYSRIRPAGSVLSSGGVGGGPEVLREAHDEVRLILQGATGRRLRSTEVSDIICHISVCVGSSGSRRSALICLFDATDDSMLLYKSGEWYLANGQRAKVNVSAILLRTDVQAERKFRKLMVDCYLSNSGEPGLYWTNDLDVGTNPCCEIALKSRSFCNLTEVNVARCETPAQFYDAAQCAALIGTLQASMTDFSYIHPDFKKNSDEEALLGVSQTGVAENWTLSKKHSRRAAQLAVAANKKWAKALGIKPAKRVTCIKPSGTTSVVLGTSSGIHASHAPYFIRRVMFHKDDKIIQYIEGIAPKLVEVGHYDANQRILCVPVEKPNAIQRDKETAIQLLNRMKHLNKNWIKPGHVEGANTHNISLTVSYKKHEEAKIVEWMWKNKDCYNGISLLPYSDSVYKQLPFEEITKERYDELIKDLPETVDFKSIDFKGTVDKRSEEVACSGGMCEIR